MGDSGDVIIVDKDLNEVFRERNKTTNNFPSFYDSLSSLMPSSFTELLRAAGVTCRSKCNNFNIINH